MRQEKKDRPDKPPHLLGGVMIYPDGSISVNSEVISRQYRERVKASARSNLEEDEWRERLKE